MVSIDTGLNENSLFILNFYYCFFALLKGKIFNNGVNCIIPWWYWCIFGPTNEIWRVYTWSEMFIKNLSDILLFWSFSSNIFSSILLFLSEKYGLHAFQNGLGLPSTLRFSKYCNLAYLFRFATRFRCHLNLTISLGLFDLFELFLRRDLIIICSRRLLLKWGFWFSRQIFYSLRSMFI